MRIACLGGGPAGLYFAISMKLQGAAHDVHVFERNRPDDTFGWGVVFSDQTVDNLLANDPVSGAAIRDEFAHWDDIEVHFRGETIRSSGHGFIGIGRRRLLNILQERARALGVALHFEHEASADLDAWADYDLVIAADGANSRIRTRYADAFGVDVQVRKNKFFWFGTRKVFEAFTFAFEQLPEGWVWAHAYRFDADLSTFIVEMAPDTWARLGFDRMDQSEAIALCERIFANHLDGRRLMSNAAHLPGPQAWLNFRRVLCERWHHRNLILLGDAAHTAHFSIGSGTKLALEDAIKLAGVLNRPGLSRQAALAEYREERQVEVLKLQNSARNSTEWFETLDRYLHFEPIQFAYSLLTRSQRVSHENLRLRDRAWLEGVERWFQSRARAAAHPPSLRAPSTACKAGAQGKLLPGAADEAIQRTPGPGEAAGLLRSARNDERGDEDSPAPPMFAPFRLRGMVLANRVVVSPMATYSAADGCPSDFHLVHYGARAQGGAGLIYTEMTCVSAEGRITPGCAGLYAPDHAEAWKRIVDFVHAGTPARLCLQLGHSGPKGSTRVGWEGYDVPLETGNWPVMAASDVPWSPANQVPRPMTRADMDRVLGEFVAATRAAIGCGFDMVELHAAHGYLLSSFITPLTNKRSDEHGGSLENRLRYPLEVFRAMRAVWPAEKPMAVRISANDWMGEAGVTPDEAVLIGQALAEAGADLIDVSAGQTWADCQPIYGRMFQTPFADQLRNEGRLTTMAVGNIYEPDHVNSILAAGRADLVALARPHLIDPMWTLRAAAAHDYREQWVPPPYLGGMAQLARNLRREQEMVKA